MMPDLTIMHDAFRTRLTRLQRVARFEMTVH
jgi:hypothetical protein